MYLTFMRKTKTMNFKIFLTSEQEKKEKKRENILNYVL
jgi:hypothetical protein